MFSSITDHFDLPTNRLYQLRDDLTRKKIPWKDLVSGNVNRQGIHFPPTLLNRALLQGLRRTPIYQPHPRGQMAARRAVSRFYKREGIHIDSEHILLTPGTSVSYWYALKMLADPGDEVLAPAPSYPLFDSIAALCGVRLVPYRLRERARWELDFEDLEKALTPRTKAIILISPHNPTGAVATEEEVARLCAIARARNLAMISDEVFSPFLYGDWATLPRPARQKTPLVITLNGFSKMLALPGIKIGWMAVTGDQILVEKALKTLDMISDTFLPVSESAQAAVPILLEKSQAFQRSYRMEMTRRRNRAVETLRKAGKSFVEPEGGFFLAVRLDDEADEEAMAYHLLKEKKVLVHPGYFYDLEDSHLVLSFATKMVPGTLFNT